MGALSRILDQESTLMHSWGKYPVLLHEPEITELFDDLDETLRTELLGPPFVSMFLDQHPIAVDRYTTEVAGAASLKTGRLLDRIKMLAELRAGAGIKLNRMQLWNARVRQVASILAERFGFSVETWGFFSGTRQPMLPWHRDHSDNIAFQVSGSKHWLVGGGIPTDASGDYRRMTGEVEEFVLSAGDVLYIPYGWAHKAEAVETTSYHLTMAVHTPSVGAVRRALVAEITRRPDVEELQPMRGFELADLVGLVPDSMAAEVHRLWEWHGGDGLKDTMLGDLSGG